MKRDFLKELELSDEVIEKIMAEHGKGIDAERKKAETLTAQRDELTERLKTASATIEKFGDANPEALKSEIEKYKAAASEAEVRELLIK